MQFLKSNLAQFTGIMIAIALIALGMGLLQEFEHARLRNVDVSAFAGWASLFLGTVFVFREPRRAS